MPALMSKTMLIAGYGTGISVALAEKFGAEGFSVALVARSTERTAAGVKALEAKGIKAAAFQADSSDPQAAAGLVKSVREKLGPISVVEWTAYAGGAGDLLKADPAELRATLDIATTCLTALVQAALPDLRAAKGAILVTNGGLGLPVQQADAAGVQWNAMGLSVANAAKHKLVRLLAEKLKPDGVYVGEVMVLAAVKGTAWDSGNATIEASTVAAQFWRLYTERKELSVQVG